jgi:glyoxylase-like metal-dependent hydrolase (beta-lactamase superfamily II)
MTPITSDIWQIGGSGLTRPEDAAVYLIHRQGHAAVVDAGCGPSVPDILDNIETCGISAGQVEWIVLTHYHFDHTGGAAALQSALGCRILAHAADAVYLEAGNDRVTAASWYGARLAPLPVDIAFEGETYALMLGDLEVNAIHTPGHSPGSMVLTVVSDGLRVLFGQDVHGPLHGDLRSNVPDYRQSLKRLLDLDADVLCEGHYGVFRGKDTIRAFISSFLKPA